MMYKDPTTHKQEPYDYLVKRLGEENAKGIVASQEGDTSINLFELNRSCNIAVKNARQKEKFTVHKTIKEIEKEIPIIKKTRSDKPTRTKKGQEQFIMIKFKTLQNPEINKMLGRASKLYDILVMFRVRNSYTGDLLKVYSRYWKKGLLATGTARAELGRLLGISVSAVTRYTKRLTKHNIIKIEKIYPNESYDGKMHNIYVIGTHKGLKKETFYIDDIS